MSKNKVFGDYVYPGMAVGIRRFDAGYRAYVQPQFYLGVATNRYHYIVKIGVNTFTVTANTPKELLTRRNAFLKSYRAGFDLPIVPGAYKMVDQHNSSVFYF